MTHSDHTSIEDPPVEADAPRRSEAEGAQRGSLRRFEGDLDDMYHDPAVPDGRATPVADPAEQRAPEPRAPERRANEHRAAEHAAGTHRAREHREPEPPGPSATDHHADDDADDAVPRATADPRSDARATSSEFTEERALQRGSTAPRRGWQRVVHVMTGGLVSPGPGARERRHDDRMANVRTPIAGSRRVVVASRKGGVGKTTTTLMLGHTFATERGDRVVALDGDPDSGTLGYRVRRETAATVRTLLDRRDFVERYANIRGYTSQAPTRLEVLASHDDPDAYESLGHDDYQTAIRLLDRHYNLILVDGGTGVLSGGAKGALGMADQLIVVMESTLDSVRSAGIMLDWLDRHGYDALVGDAVAVVNRAKPRSAVRRDVIDAHFGRRCRAIVTVPDDPALEPGTQTTLEALRGPTRDAYLDLAAAVAESFGSTGPRIGDDR